MICIAQLYTEISFFKPKKKKINFRNLKIFPTLALGFVVTSLLNIWKNSLGAQDTGSNALWPLGSQTMMNDNYLNKWAWACVLQALLFVVHRASFPQKEQEDSAISYFSLIPWMLLKSLTWTETWCKIDPQRKNPVKCPHCWMRSRAHKTWLMGRHPRLFSLLELTQKTLN